MACATWIDAHPPEDGLARAHKRQRAEELAPMPTESKVISHSNGESSPTLSETVHSHFGRRHCQELVSTQLQAAAGEGEDRAGAGCPP